MPRLKNKPAKESKKERKARQKEAEKREEEASASTCEPAAAPPPPAYTELEIPSEFLEDIENDEERHKFIGSALLRVKEVADTENDVRKEIREFHARIKKSYASEMNTKERKEANALYAKLADTKKGHYEYINALLNRMKTWRSEAADKAKATGELNALELLKARHGCLPVMDVGNNLAPYGTGALAWPDTTRPTKGDEVIAFLEESKTWIVAEVAGSKSNHRYECVDVDDEEKKVSTFARKQIIPLPKYTCDYEKYPYMAFAQNAHVLALFPGTTCFYPGIVRESPTAASGIYKVSFVDTENPNKFAEPVEVSDRYIVAWRKDPKMYIRPEKRMQLEAEASGVVEEVVPVVTDTKKKSHKKKTVLLEEEILDKDIPGPAPKAQPVTYYESPDEDAKKVKKGKKKEKKVKIPKVKIRRARVPEHKKKQHTRLFGKRRKNKKPKVLADPGAAGPSDVKDDSPTGKEEDDVVHEVGEKDADSEPAKAPEQLDESGDEVSEKGDKESEDDDEEQEDEEQPSNEGASGNLSFPKFDESDNESEKSSEQDDEEEDLLLPELEQDIPTGYPTIQSDDSSDDSCDSDAGSYLCDNKKDGTNKNSDNTDDL